MLLSRIFVALNVMFLSIGHVLKVTLMKELENGKDLTTCGVNITNPKITILVSARIKKIFSKIY